MLDILIPYIRDVHEGIELKFALRSIETYLTGYKDVYIIGDPPDWYKGHSHYMPDYPGRKQYSIYKKLLASIVLPCSEDFIMWNDDHYLLKPIHTADFKYWHNGLMRDAMKTSYGRYRISIRDTITMVPQDPLNFDIHTPIVYNKTKFKDLLGGMLDEICIKSYYTNWVKPDTTEFMQDCKIMGECSRLRIKELIFGRTFFSSSGVCHGMVALLEELFPKKSKFEK